jgi:NADPH:quinone reductase
MARTVIIEATGGPEVLTLVDRPVGDPGPGELRIAQRACGLNFIDVYQRSGMYPMPLPAALGMEASGVVEAVGGRHPCETGGPRRLCREPARGLYRGARHACRTGLPAARRDRL